MASKLLQPDNTNRKNDFVKYGRLTSLGDPRDIAAYSKVNFEVFEKIDGGNCQVRNPAGFQLVPGTKANVLTGGMIETREWFKKFVKWVYSNSSLYNLPSNFVMFGEWSGNHAVQYDPRFEDKFFVIDVYDLEKERFMEFSAGRKTLEEKGIEGVLYPEVLHHGNVTPKTLKALLEKPSAYYRGPKEGVVLKDYNSTNQTFLKAYHPDFTEKQPVAPGRYNYLTPARFRKNIFRALEDMGKRAVSSEDVINAIVDDIKAEEGVRIEASLVLERLHSYASDGKLGRAARFMHRC